MGVGATSSSEREPSARYRLWVAVATALVVVGVGGAAFAAVSVARNDADKSRQSFRSSSAEVASTLQLAIQHEEDLIVSASGHVAQNPHTSNAQFVRWANSVHSLARYPELNGLGYAVIVPARELPAFARRAEADPPGPLSANGRFEVVPPGNRPFYCLTVGLLARGRPDNPAGLDYCAVEPVASAQLSSRDSGQSVYVPFRLPKATWLIVQTPVYRGGIVPPTVALRRAAFVGWVGIAVVPKVVVDRALQSHPDMAVAFRYRRGSSNVVFRSGAAPPGAQADEIDLKNGWTVRTFGHVDSASIWVNAHALSLLLGGIVLSVLLAGLMFVLGTGRARALRLVRLRTGELRHQALHDALTGLPNRVLIADRIEQLLVRNRRNRTQGAVLYVDLDEFKNVNDTLGHATGDQLLTAVTARLTSTLRDADTIGRMGGDEFVVLIDGGEQKVAPEIVAERVLEAMRQPFELDGLATPLTINTSVGIAIGDRASVGDLLRDADVALYKAKAAGKNCFAIFAEEDRAVPTVPTPRGAAPFKTTPRTIG